MSDQTRVARGRPALGVLGLALVIISAMDSIRNLPSTATFGWACLFLYAIAVVAYLVPVALTSAELATAFGGDGGVYSWVKAAFGSRWGFLAVWCDWAENVVWFPTVLVFLATTAAYVIDPALTDNKAFLVTVMLVLFWGATAVAAAGTLRSARWTGIGTVVGTAVPTLVVIGLGVYWLVSDRPSQIEFSGSALLPEWEGLSSLVYVAGIVVAFAGMEVGGYYANVCRDPKRTYPRAVFLAAAVVATLAALGSLAVSIVVPRSDINLAGGVMQALTAFFDDLGIGWLVRPVGVLVIVGVLCNVLTWCVGPAEGMRSVAAGGGLSPWWRRTNRHGAPITILVLQASLASVLTLLMLFIDSINTYYWILTALVAQTFLVMYLLMYAALIRLRRTHPEVARPVKVPGGTVGLVVIIGFGVVGALFTFVLGFVPASHLSVDATALYVGGIALGIVVVCGVPFLLHRQGAMPAGSSSSSGDRNVSATTATTVTTKPT